VILMLFECQHRLISRHNSVHNLNPTETVAV
jgi:hypothetical protein